MEVLRSWLSERQGPPESGEEAEEEVAGGEVMRTVVVFGVSRAVFSMCGLPLVGSG